MPEDLSHLLKDIQFGSIQTKTEAIGKLRLLPGVVLSTVQPSLRKALETAPEGSVLKFYAASALAAFGDADDTVAEALITFISREPYMLVRFPWANDKLEYFHPNASTIAYIRPISPQIGTIEAFGRMKGNALAAQALSKYLEHVEDGSLRLFAIYAAGANGHPSLRPQLEYLREKDSALVESQAARIALEHFGSGNLFEIAAEHGRLAPPKAEKKSGCFIASAVYGPLSPEVALLRQFRDNILIRRTAGRLFVNSYYALSPAVASVLHRFPLLKAMFRYFFLPPFMWYAKRSKSAK